jgi:sporulation protein YlmC with PRC-barrel domain
VLIGFDLMDRQILDRDGQPVGKVDDVELTVDANGRLHLTALLVGQEALGTRIGGDLGRWMAGVAMRLRGPHAAAPIRIPYEVVADVGAAITLSLRRELLTEPPLESWLRDNLIGRIPGAGHAGS